VTSALGTVLLSDAVLVAQTRNASDVHLTPGQPPMVRIDGTLERLGDELVSRYDLDALEAAFLADGDRRRLRDCGDVTAICTHHGCLLRVHAFRTGEGTGFAFRFLERELRTLGELGVPEVMGRLARRQSGLAIVSGPTGSGKSTSLAAILATLSAEEPKKIVTIEDPIEYPIHGGKAVVVQRQIGRDVTDFAQAVRGALRSDPDVIAIGEMRDHETVAAAIVAAETGHLVLATLHAADSAQTVDRLVDAFSAQNAEAVRGRIAQVLLGVMCQRLVKRANGGRVLAAELLVATDAVRHMIRDGKHHQLPTVIATGRRFGMQSLDGHLCDLVAAGVVTGVEAERVRS
jgi:twitching motility protein PilT